jgi:predicted hydrocarbon binding protein/KaiC/GvpD/RAD55 family RecA-like ATPase
MSLAQIQEAPDRSVILLVGPPGANKSAFCQQMVLNALALDRPVIYLTTERGATDAIGLLKDRGLGGPVPAALHFVDAFSQTVGVAAAERPDTIQANCLDLNSITIAITRLQERIGQSGILLAFDSLTSPYLLSGAEVIRFMRLFLSRFAAEGNSVVALIDEGCGKAEDLVALMSIADGVITIETEEKKRLLRVVKHPRVEPTTIAITTDRTRAERIWDLGFWDEQMMRRSMDMLQGKAGAELFGRELGDYVNVFWLNLAHWSGMLWDPKRFPEMTYELGKAHGAWIREMPPFLPWHRRLLWEIFTPKNLSRVRDMRRLSNVAQSLEQQRWGILEYLKDVSNTDEHHFRLYESSDCWGFEEAGTTIASHVPPSFAGLCKGLEIEERDWNAVETKCIGLGDPYCEFKLVPGGIAELSSSLEKESSVIARMHELLMHRLVGFLIDRQPLVERPSLGSDVGMQVVFHVLVHPALAGERYRMALRMGGARTGKEIGERLMAAGVKENEALKRLFDLMEHCKVGKVAVDKTIRMKENCESIWVKFFMAKWGEPSCYFTTGLLNGFFSAVKHQHVREIKCIAMGDPYCEWEIIS